MSLTTTTTHAGKSVKRHCLIMLHSSPSGGRGSGGGGGGDDEIRQTSHRPTKRRCYRCHLIPPRCQRRSSYITNAKEEEEGRAEKEEDGKSAQTLNCRWSNKLCVSLSKERLMWRNPTAKRLRQLRRVFAGFWRYAPDALVHHCASVSSDEGDRAAGGASTSIASRCRQLMAETLTDSFTLSHAWLNAKETRCFLEDLPLRDTVHARQYRAFAALQPLLAQSALSAGDGDLLPMTPRCIGKGSYGAVLLAKERVGAQRFVVKTMQIADEFRWTCAVREHTILAQLRTLVSFNVLLNVNHISASSFRVRPLYEQIEMQFVLDHVGRSMHDCLTHGGEELDAVSLMSVIAQVLITFYTIGEQTGLVHRDATLTNIIARPWCDAVPEARSLCYVLHPALVGDTAPTPLIRVRPSRNGNGNGSGSGSGSDSFRPPLLQTKQGRERAEGESTVVSMEIAAAAVAPKEATAARSLEETRSRGACTTCALRIPIPKLCATLIDWGMASSVDKPFNTSKYGIVPRHDDFRALCRARHRQPSRRQRHRYMHADLPTWYVAAIAYGDQFVETLAPRHSTACCYTSYVNLGPKLQDLLQPLILYYRALTAEVVVALRDKINKAQRAVLKRWLLAAIGRFAMPFVESGVDTPLANEDIALALADIYAPRFLRAVGFAHPEEDLPHWQAAYTHHSSVYAREPDTYHVIVQRPTGALNKVIGEQMQRVSAFHQPRRAGYALQRLAMMSLEANSPPLSPSPEPSPSPSRFDARVAGASQKRKQKRKRAKEEWSAMDGET